MTDVYQVVGQNNRNLIVQSKRLAPFHEDLTKVQQFEPSSVAPGHWTKIKIDFKHSTDRELILNDIRLQFELDLSARDSVGQVYAVRGTDLIREMWVKINEDVVFKVERKGELTMLYMMNNHRTAGEPSETQDAYLLHAGIIPQGQAPFFVYDATNKAWNENQASWPAQTKRPGYEKFDGRPRLIFDDTSNPDYRFKFDMSLNQLIGPIFHRLHTRRIEHAQIELRFEPWVSTEECQDFLLFRNNPVLSGGVAVPHPYSVARFVNVQIRQYRTTLLDGIQGFTLPDSKMLSWLMHRYSQKSYSFNFDTQTYLDIQLNDWEIRTNITRVYWMLAPPAKVAGENNFTPLGEPCEGYDALSGVEIRWKNDVVLDLASTFDVYRHYALSENKRHGFDDPFVKFIRLLDHSWRPTIPTTATSGTMSPGAFPNTKMNDELVWYSWKNWDNGLDYENLRYEWPIYHVDLNMNIFQGAPGAEVVGGIVNDTSDYVIRIKKLSDAPFRHTGTRTLYVFLEYQTLVNLSGGSNQFAKGSQIVTKQLNLQ
jgi:hypothetical protein